LPLAASPWRTHPAAARPGETQAARLVDKRTKLRRASDGSAGPQPGRRASGGAVVGGCAPRDAGQCEREATGVADSAEIVIFARVAEALKIKGLRRAKVACESERVRAAFGS
jgi:hypothetical protein